MNTLESIDNREDALDSLALDFQELQRELPVLENVEQFFNRPVFR